MISSITRGSIPAFTHNIKTLQVLTIFLLISTDLDMEHEFILISVCGNSTTILKTAIRLGFVNSLASVDMSLAGEAFHLNFLPNYASIP